MLGGAPVGATESDMPWEVGLRGPGMLQYVMILSSKYGIYGFYYSPLIWSTGTEGKDCFLTL